MEYFDINLKSQSDGRGQDGSGAAKPLERDGGTSPNIQTQATPFTQHPSDVKPPTERPSIDQACYISVVMTVPRMFLTQVGFFYNLTLNTA